MPVWLWILVVCGLSAGLIETLVGDRRRVRVRIRSRRHEAEARGFHWTERDTTRRVAPLLALVPSTEGAHDVHGVATGSTSEGIPLTLFDFEADDPAGTLWTGFVLHYPTDWPTLELLPDGLEPLVHTRSDDERSTHDLSRALLGSDLLHLMAAHPHWVFALTGDAVLGAAPVHDTDDFAMASGIAEGFAIRLPAQAIEPWRRSEPYQQRRAAGA